jgi:hypothetical protein
VKCHTQQEDKARAAQEERNKTSWDAHQETHSSFTFSGCTWASGHHNTSWDELQETELVHFRWLQLNFDPTPTYALTVTSLKKKKLSHSRSCFKAFKPTVTTVQTRRLTFIYKNENFLSQFQRKLCVLERQQNCC